VAELVPELQVLGRRQRGQHAPLLAELGLDVADPGEDLEGRLQLVAADPADARPELVDDELHPQLGGLVLDDEEHLVVMLAERDLGAEQLVEVQVP
jgi:hypothetical protein